MPVEMSTLHSSSPSKRRLTGGITQERFDLEPPNFAKTSAYGHAECDVTSCFRLAASFNGILHTRLGGTSGGFVSRLQLGCLFRQPALYRQRFQAWFFFFFFLSFCCLFFAIISVYCSAESPASYKGLCSQAQGRDNDGDDSDKTRCDCHSPVNIDCPHRRVTQSIRRT